MYTDKQNKRVILIKSAKLQRKRGMGQNFRVDLRSIYTNQHN